MMGQQGRGTVNENGELILDLCAFNRMVIGGSMFPQHFKELLNRPAPSITPEIFSA